MAEDTKKPPTPPSPAGAATAAAPNADGDIATRVTNLVQDVKTLETEIKILEGRLKNRNPVALEQSKKENEALKVKIQNLEKAFFVLLSGTTQPKKEDEQKLGTEALRLAAVDYFKASNTNIDLWKNIES